MTPEAFRRWLAEMQAKNNARSEAECIRLLGMHRNSLMLLKAKGADQRTALACRALLHKMDPYE